MIEADNIIHGLGKMERRAVALALAVYWTRGLQLSQVEVKEVADSFDRFIQEGMK